MPRQSPADPVLHVILNQAGQLLVVLWHLFCHICLHSLLVKRQATLPLRMQDMLPFLPCCGSLICELSSSMLYVSSSDAQHWGSVSSRCCSLSSCSGPRRRWVLRGGRCCPGRLDRFLASDCFFRYASSPSAALLSSRTTDVSNSVPPRCVYIAGTRLGALHSQAGGLKGRR
jgi:hypothetical protein